MVLTNWKFVATVRGIGFQSVESKPIPLAQNPPPTHDLPRRGYFSQPGVAASAATPGKTPPTRDIDPVRVVFVSEHGKSSDSHVWLPANEAILTG